MRKTRKTVRILATLLAAILAASCLSAAFCFTASAASVSGYNWMSAIADDKLITQINIPGTHDSAACYIQFAAIMQNQDKPIFKQLNMGVRFFDIRINHEGGKLKSVHGDSACKADYGFAKQLEAKDIVKMMTDFLRKNPGETILFFLREEHTSTGTAMYDRFYDECIAPDRGMWYTSAVVPTLGEARGKIIMINTPGNVSGRFNETNSGILLPHGTVQSQAMYNYIHAGSVGKNSKGGTVNLYYQDSYRLLPDNKTKTVGGFWDSGLDPNDFNINFSCCTNTFTAYYASRKVVKYLNGYNFQKGRYYGILAMDFAGDTVVRNFYMSNEPSMTKAPVGGGEIYCSTGYDFMQYMDYGFLKFVQFFGMVFAFAYI